VDSTDGTDEIDMDTDIPHEDPMETCESEDNSDAVTDEAGWCGFKVVGDNIDKNVRPRHMRLDKGTQSLHYFNAYAIMDRVDCSSKEIPHHQPLAILWLSSQLKMIILNSSATS
jgi:hypothetical protein